MLNNATGFKKIYIACGQTDLRRGIEGLANIIRFQFQLDPYDKDTPVSILRQKEYQNQRPSMGR